MAVFKSNTGTFINQVRGDYTGAYFRIKLFWAALGRRIMSDFQIKPGKKVDLPFFLKMGDAEKPGEDDRLAVDSFGDKSISTSVYEVAKAWGITDSGRYAKGSTDEEWEDEASSQVGQRLAEMVDKDALACLNNDGTASVDGTAGNDPKGHDAIDRTKDLTTAGQFTGEKGLDDAKVIAMMANINALQRGFTDLFGDRQKEANLMVMHSKSYTDVLLGSTAGFLKADAVSPLGSVVKGYEGNFLGKHTYTIDNISKGTVRTITDSAGTTQKYQTRKTFILKPNAFLFLVKQNPKHEEARDLLGRIDYAAVTQWYTFYPLHKQNNDDDIRAGAISFLTSEEVA